MDFCDKLVISITLVIVTVFCVLNTFCFASDSVSLGEPIHSSVIEGIYPDSTDKKTGVFISRDDVGTNYYTCYFRLVSGHKYIIYNLTTSSYSVRFSSSVPSVGVDFIRFGLVPSNSSLNFIADNDNYLFISSSSTSGLNIDGIVLYDITRSMSSSVEILANTVGISQLWSTFEKSVPYIAVVVLSSFGFYLIIHNILEISKGRDD